MEDLTLRFFPLPHVFKGKRKDGLVVDWHERCGNCDRQCETSAGVGLQMCSYGVNFKRIDVDLLIAGIVVKDYSETSAARKKALRTARDMISTQLLERIVERARESTQALEDELRAKKDEVIKEYRESKTYQAEVIQELRPQIQDSFGQVHDYKAFVQQIVQNINVILATKFPGDEIDVALGKAEREEVAIYWAARLMEEKLDAEMYLTYPERIADKGKFTRFRFHGMVTKYLRIYESRLKSKRLKLRFEGKSWGKIEGNANAISIIPHCLIDNAIKYAPSGTEIVIGFTEDRSSVKLDIESYGPPIEDDELERGIVYFTRVQ